MNVFESVLCAVLPTMMMMTTTKTSDPESSGGNENEPRRQKQISALQFTFVVTKPLVEVNDCYGWLAVVYMETILHGWYAPFPKNEVALNVESFALPH